jgi:hypothetical protein
MQARLHGTSELSSLSDVSAGPASKHVASAHVADEQPHERTSLRGHVAQHALSAKLETIASHELAVSSSATCTGRPSGGFY